jgi:hypothetical protein
VRLRCAFSVHRTPTLLGCALGPADAQRIALEAQRVRREYRALVDAVPVDGKRVRRTLRHVCVCVCVRARARASSDRHCKILTWCLISLLELSAVPARLYLAP